MLHTKEQVMARLDVRAIAQFLALASAAIFLPFVVHVQFITGSIVNAILILALFLVGIRSALIICLIPSMMALAGGLLPAILAPAVPFIMISNVILVLCVDYANRRQITPNSAKNYWIGVVVGAGLKFSFLFFSVSIISRLLIKQELAVKIAQMMSWPQFTTAIAGGVIAWAVLRYLKKLS